MKVGGYDGLWAAYGSAMGKSVLAKTSVMTTVSATSNISTTAAAITAMVNASANMTTVMPTTSTADGACFKMTPYWGNMFRPIDDPDYPWLGLWTTLPIMGVWYWCTDQVIHQNANSPMDLLPAHLQYYPSHVEK